ncbi:polysaccharide deacetylase family protein [Thermodesulfobacteriota bacterium]
MENILTVDLEDWFHICGVKEIMSENSWAGLESRIVANTEKILKILSQKNTLATFFILGFIAQKNPELIFRIHTAGHEIATHGYAHLAVYTMTPESFREDIKKACDVISGITGQPIKGYRAPEWSIRDDSLWALDILEEEGFEYDSSMAPLPIIGNQSYSRVPHLLELGAGKLWEFPPLVVRTGLINLPFGGGWGLRIFPYPLIRAAMQKMNTEGSPALVYIHPREFDPCVPDFSLPFVKRLVLNARIQKTETTVKRLLNDFSFSTISKAVDILGNDGK